jgi:hypothetical protein
MLMQQHGQQQAQYAWMLQQYSMAAVAAAATGQPPPPPPPPPPLSGAFGNLMGWPHPHMPWQQQQVGPLHCFFSVRARHACTALLIMPATGLLTRMLVVSCRRPALQLPGLGFPGPSLTSPPAFQVGGAASSSLLPPPSGAGAASAPTAALPALPLPLPAELLSGEQLAKKEARLMVSWCPLAVPLCFDAGCLVACRL